MSEITKLDVISGFLGAGKTTLINKLLAEVYKSEKIAVLENEFGEIGVDGDLLSGCNLTVKEILNGCICCTLQGNFIDGIKELAESYRPDRIIIEPTGIGKLGDILEACRLAMRQAPVRVQTVMTVVNAAQVSAFLEVSGEFYHDQIQNSPVIVLSAVQNLTAKNPPLPDILVKIRKINPNGIIFTEPWDTLDSLKLLAIAEEAAKKAGLAETSQSGSFTSSAALSGPEEETEHEHHDHNHNHDHLLENDGFDSCSFILRETWNRKEMEDFIARMRDGSCGLIFRVKGFFPVREGFDKLDYVYGNSVIKPSDYRGEGKIVIIGREIRKDDLRRYAQRQNS
jgi:G3E family GTPase